MTAPRRKLLPAILGGLAALLLLIAGGSWLYWRSLWQPTGGEAMTLEIHQGDSLGKLTNQLEEKNIVRNARLLRYLLSKQGTDKRLQEGYYDFHGKMNLEEVARRFQSPSRLIITSVTIPEGKRIRDLPAIFKKAGFDAAAIAEELKNTTLSSYAGNARNLEGFVFPDTYQFRTKDNARTIVRQMVERMNTEFSAENKAAAKTLGLSVRDWVILASMVQAEAANSEEMPLIAGVFLNRLKVDMPLGSDPTVAYGLGKNLPELDRSAGDFVTDTPYSTYTRRGLPAGPINNPGRAALQSVLHAQLKLPDGRDALYFLHARDRKIYVNHTYNEHLRDNELHR